MRPFNSCSNKPDVEHGDCDAGLQLTTPINVEKKFGITCASTASRCPYEATITVTPTELKLYKYCVKTKDAYKYVLKLCDKRAIGHCLQHFIPLLCPFANRP